jgi:hypothetical protein
MFPWTGKGKIELHYSEPADAHGGSEHPLRRETQHEDDGRAGTAESTAKKFAPLRLALERAPRQ